MFGTQVGIPLFRGPIPFLSGGQNLIGRPDIDSGIRNIGNRNANPDLSHWTTGAWDASRRRRWLLWLPRWSVPFSVCSYVHYSAMKQDVYDVYTPPPGRAAAGRRRGGSGAAVGRASTWAQALPTAVDRARAAAARPPFTPQRDVQLHGPVHATERHGRQEHDPGEQLVEAFGRTVPLGA